SMKQIQTKWSKMRNLYIEVEQLLEKNQLLWEKSADKYSITPETIHKQLQILQSLIRDLDGRTQIFDSLKIMAETLSHKQTIEKVNKLIMTKFIIIKYSSMIKSDIKYS
ncbi:unnamed protein product, partial [Didymodactylos carnosus]